MKHFTPYNALVVFGLTSVVMIFGLMYENSRLRSGNSRLRSDIAGYELLTEGYRQLAELRQASDAAWLDYYTNNRIDAKLRNWQATLPMVETIPETLFFPFRPVKVTPEK